MWKIEEGSEFPILRRRSDGSQCLAYDQFTTDENGNKVPIKFRPVDARRQNFGTVVTPEGIWMIGGLLEPAADLPYRARSDMFNIEGNFFSPYFVTNLTSTSPQLHLNFTPTSFEVLLFNNDVTLKVLKNHEIFRMHQKSTFERCLGVQSKGLVKISDFG